MCMLSLACLYVALYVTLCVSLSVYYMCPCMRPYMCIYVSLYASLYVYICVLRHSVCPHNVVMFARGPSWKDMPGHIRTHIRTHKGHI